MSSKYILHHRRHDERSAFNIHFNSCTAFMGTADGYGGSEMFFPV
jgi:hypothetical protein